MFIKNFSRQCALLFLILATAVCFAQAQTAQSGAPRQEKLLNGLRLLIWNDRTQGAATVKLRIHSGAAFDTLGKEGTMALVADSFFPNDSTKQFFAEELGGSLVVESNYDYIQINATGDADKILTILETFAAAVRPAIDKETTAKIRLARLDRVKELEKNPAYLADLAVAKRLLGDFPYGRSAEGTGESLSKIDFADLLLAKQRFLTADNATLAVSGAVKPEFVFKAVRQLFGGWEKADRKVPATFAAPAAPDPKFFLIKTEIERASELRFAFRGAARRDADFSAVRILTNVLQNRLRAKEGEKVTLQQNSYFLLGLVTVKLSDWDQSALKTAGADVSLPANFFDYVQQLLATDITSEEFQTAKADFLKTYAAEDNLEAWLDADTYNLAAMKTNQAAAQNATLADVQKTLERWRREAVVKTLLYKAAA